MSMREVWDRIGISASLLCVVHCLATPLLVALAPMFSDWMPHTTFHSIIVVLVVPVAGWALWNGYQLHRSRRILYLGGLGLLLIAAAMIAPDPRYETGLMILAGLTLASAHLSNLRACRAHR